MGFLNTGQEAMSSLTGVSFAQLLSLTSWIIGLVAGQSHKPFPVKHMANPSKRFTADVLDIWPVEARAERRLLICHLPVPAVVGGNPVG